MSCQFCRPNISNEDHAKFWRSWVAGGYEQVLEDALAAGLIIDKRDIRTHFEYHHPLQPAPARIGNLNKFDKQVEKMADLRVNTSDLLFRVPGLDGKIIGELIYWSGDPDKLVAAEKSALRDLTKLIKGDYLYRVFFSNLPGGALRPLFGRGLFYLNRRGATLLEHHRDITKISESEIITDISQVGSWQKVHSEFRSNQLLASISQELPGNKGMRWKIIDTNTVDSKNNPQQLAIGWDNRNWFGRKHLPRYSIRGAGQSKVDADSMAALSLRQGNDPVELLPFLFYHHSYRRLSRDLSNRLLKCFDWEKSGQISETFPNLPFDLIFPTVIVCQDDAGYQAIIEACKSIRSPREFMAIICKEKHFCLDKPVFRRLFHKASSDNLISLIEALLIDRNQREPIITNQIEWLRQ